MYAAAGVTVHEPSAWQQQDTPVPGHDDLSCEECPASVCCGMDAMEPIAAFAELDLCSPLCVIQSVPLPTIAKWRNSAAAKALKQRRAVRVVCMILCKYTGMSGNGRSPATQRGITVSYPVLHLLPPLRTSVSLAPTPYHRGTDRLVVAQYVPHGRIRRQYWKV